MVFMIKTYFWNEILIFKLQIFKFKFQRTFHGEREVYEKSNNLVFFGTIRYFTILCVKIKGSLI